MNESTIRHRLSRLGLSDRQATIYLSLIKTGDMRVRDIVEATHIARSTVYEDIKYLRKNGLVEEIVDQEYKQLRAYPLGLLKHKLQEQISTLEQNIDQIDEVETAIEKMANSNTSPSVVVRYYKGQNGAKQLLWNTLKAKQVVYVYSEWGRGKYVGTDFYERFVAESRARSIQENVITPDSDRMLDSIREDTESALSRTRLDDIRCINSDNINIQGETFIYDDIYAQIFLKDKMISGFEIESSKFVAMQRSMFKNQWHVATPIKTLL